MTVAGAIGLSPQHFRIDALPISSYHLLSAEPSREFPKASSNCAQEPKP